MDIGQLVDAVCAYLVKHPDDDETRRRLSQALGDKPSNSVAADPTVATPGVGDAANAVDDASEDEEDEEPPPVTFADIKSAFVGDDHKRVVELCTRMLDTRPHATQALRYKGRALHKLCRYVDARDVLASAQALDYDDDVEGILRDCQKRLKASSRPPPKQPPQHTRRPPPKQQQSPHHPPPPKKQPSPQTTSAPTGGGSSSNMFEQLCNPEVMQGVQQMLQDPNMMNAIQSSPLFESLMKGGGSK